VDGWHPAGNPLNVCLAVWKSSLSLVSRFAPVPPKNPAPTAEAHSHVDVGVMGVPCIVLVVVRYSSSSLGGSTVHCKKSFLIKNIFFKNSKFLENV